MSEKTKSREYRLVESDDLIWDELRQISDRLGWELGQTLKACFALGWEQLAKNNKEIFDDKPELE